jgi:hypothetical protein
MPFMAGLAFALFPTGLPLAQPLVDPPIHRWRLATVVAIFLPLPFQFVETRHQLRNLRESLPQLLSQFLLLCLPRCFLRQQRCYLLFEFGYPFLYFHSPHFISSFNPSWAVTPDVSLPKRPRGRPRKAALAPTTSSCSSTLVLSIPHFGVWTIFWSLDDIHSQLPFCTKLAPSCEMVHASLHLVSANLLAFAAEQ